MSGFLTRPDTIFYHEERYDPNRTDPTYIGKNERMDAGVDDLDWTIWKITADRTRVAYGSWTNRASYFYDPVVENVVFEGEDVTFDGEQVVSS